MLVRAMWDQEELLSNLVYGRPESSGFPANLLS